MSPRPPHTLSIGRLGIPRQGPPSQNTRSFTSFARLACEAALAGALCLLDDGDPGAVCQLNRHVE